ncbi:flagellar basal body protein [Ramlibacter sp. G-1-2-2]|uniref:Flagellar basal body rod protein FlgB n=1 Tax=Ramlibacter agri TaxID=2728837 RepID=A0A848H1B8_9BURK|nr:flagellar basal body protein [Ramlibacter agri]NML42920.1 flagellar basal body protein [Ramlibacter agri]
MTPSLEAVTTATLAKALDAAALRHQAVSANVANANTEGWQALRLQFAAQLEDARDTLRERGSVNLQQVQALQPQLEADLDEAGAPVAVQLDAQVTEMARNAVHYQALLQGLSRHFALLSAAAAEGRH